MLKGISTRGHSIISQEKGTQLLGSTQGLQRLFTEVGILIVDSYKAEAKWETQQRNWAECIVVIDDLADRPHNCDVLIDQTPGRCSTDYRNLVPNNCDILTGGSFAILRPTFLQQRRKLGERNNDLRRVIINFGGSDPMGVTSKALSGIIQTGLNIEIDVVLGANPGNLETIWTLAGGSDPLKIRIHQFVDDMASLFAKADLAIGAGGSSLLEKCSLGLPSLIITTAKNQDLISKNLAFYGAAKLLGNCYEVDATILAEAVTRLAANKKALAKMSDAATKICDGKGGLRVVSALLPNTTTCNGDTVALRRINHNDEQIIYDWQTEPDARRFFRQPEAPTRENHALWFKQRLNTTDNITCIVLVAGKAAGLVRLDCMDQPENQDAMEVSILIATAYRGKGVGVLALRLIRKLSGVCRLCAEVNPLNTRSVNVFKNAGFQQIGVDRFQSAEISPVTPR